MISSHRFRLYLLAMLILGGFCLLLYRLWDLQIDKQEYYIAQLPETDKAYQRVPAVRGEIFDRNGIVLAKNKLKLEVGLNLATAEAVWREDNAVALLKKEREEPKFEWDPKRPAETDIKAILDETVFPRLDKLGLYKEPTQGTIDALRLWYRTNRGVIPYPYDRGEDGHGLDRDRLKDFERFAAYAENAYELPGIVLRERAMRAYPLRALGCHFMGYVKQAGSEKPPEDDKPSDPDKDWQFFENDDVGMSGMERALDADLRGHPGERVFLKNEFGRLADEILPERRDPVPGASVFLTIDARVQMIAEMALRDGGVGRGAVVVMDPNTGEILAFVAVPSFDPNHFVPSISTADWKALNEDPFTPLLNRVLSYYAPGSTFKLVTALAASTMGKTGSQNCPGQIPYGNYAAKCWTMQKGGYGHGTLTLDEGLMRSCNCYFYRAGNAAGMDAVERMGKLMGIGTDQGIRLPYQLHPMPGEEWWKQQNKGPWTNAKTAQCSIGQGEVLATPLDMCVVASAVANGGKIYEPTMVNRKTVYSRDKDGRIIQTTAPFSPKLRLDLLDIPDGPSVKKKDIETIRKGMWRVVNDINGTAKRAKSEVGIAGKTGTAQMKRFDKTIGKVIPDNHTWFVSFAPFDNPKVAVAVVVANGTSGGGVAAPVAKRIIERTLALDSGNYRPAVVALEPAEGHFRHLESIEYAGEAVPAGVDDSADTVVDEEEATMLVPGSPVPDAAAPRVEEDPGATPAPADGQIKKQNFRKQDDSATPDGEPGLN